jgi:diguanylate cyclase (GGDEF)-like protein
MTVPHADRNRVLPNLRPSTDISPATPEERRAFRLSVARHDAPAILILAGALILVFSILAYVVDPSGGLKGLAADVPLGVLFVVVGLVLDRLPMPDAGVPWLFAGMSLLLVAGLLAEVWEAPGTLSTAYVLLIICAFGPPTLAWAPFLSASAVMIVAVGFVTSTWLPTEWPDWSAAALAAALIGALMLSVRIRSVNALADASQEVQRLAVTDELTGLLNRHGVALQLPPLVANAARYYQSMFVTFVDIDGLKQANDKFGHEFGDEVIITAAKAVASAVREGDIIARWGGDELIVAGVGTAPDAADFSSRIVEGIRHSGIDVDKWPGTVSLGFASAPVGRIDIDQLIAEADADMYRRRAER